MILDFFHSIDYLSSGGINLSKNVRSPNLSSCNNFFFYLTSKLGKLSVLIFRYSLAASYFLLCASCSTYKCGLERLIRYEMQRYLDGMRTPTQQHESPEYNLAP
jgi:hypothetical protein